VKAGQFRDTKMTDNALFLLSPSSAIDNEDPLERVKDFEGLIQIIQGRGGMTTVLSEIKKIVKGSQTAHDSLFH
jgi:hypothetical protein